MNDLNKYIVCDWFFENNTQVSIDKNKKTITLSIAPDRHNSNMEVTNSYEDFLKDISGMQTIFLNNPNIQKKNVAELIIETVTYYASEKYVQDIERFTIDSKTCLDSIKDLKDYSRIPNFENLLTVPNFSVNEIKSEKYFSDFVNEIKGTHTQFNFSFRDTIFFNLMDLETVKEVEIKLPKNEEWIFYSGFFANNLYFLHSKELLFVMNEKGDVLKLFNKNEPILNFFRIIKIAWLDNTLFIKLSNKVNYSESVWLAWDYKIEVINGKVLTYPQELEVKNKVEKSVEVEKHKEKSEDLNANKNQSKLLNTPNILSIISRIQRQQKNTIIAYGILIFILNIGPVIGLFYNEKAAYLLIPTFILSVLLVIQMVKIARYTLKYSTASIIELSVSSTPTNTTYKHSTIVNFALVNEHILYEAKNDGINFNKKETVGMMKYQISPEMKNLITNKKEITFITKGKNEIATILEVK